MLFRSKDKITQLQPEDKRDGFLKNLSDLAEEYRQGNIECMILAFRRKEEESTITYFIDRDNPHMYKLLDRLKHDMLGLYDYDCMVKEYDVDEEGIRGGIRKWNHY